MAKTPTYSEDGEFMWNGDEWIPSPPGYIPDKRDIKENITNNSLLDVPNTQIHNFNKSKDLSVYLNLQNLIITAIVLMLIIAVSRYLFAPEKHTLEYYVVGSNDEEFTINFNLYNPATNDDEYGSVVYCPIGSCAGLKQWSNPCIDSLWCESSISFDFEYNGAFSAFLHLWAPGMEDNPPSLCLEILLDGVQIDIACGMSVDSNDGLNVATLYSSTFVNSNTLDSIE
jgi:hypothetical protein|tara:strand:+ start:833 stop:1513 length:681 start_codon:yes stop_codon:yes gene_type:complete